MKVLERCTSKKMVLCTSSAAANVKKTGSNLEEFLERLSGLRNEANEFCDVEA